MSGKKKRKVKGKRKESVERISGTKMWRGIDGLLAVPAESSLLLNYIIETTTNALFYVMLLPILVRDISTSTTTTADVVAFP
jgi:hypothetical protein